MQNRGFPPNSPKIRRDTEFQNDDVKGLVQPIQCQDAWQSGLIFRLFNNPTAPALMNKRRHDHIFADN
jgi:hypothetical protein